MAAMVSTGGRRCTIVGAGLAGSLLACYLARRGWSVSVHERRADPRAVGYAGGRSINLALSVRGIRGLEGVGLSGAVLADAIPMRGRAVHDAQGRLAFQAYSKNRSDAINSVSRGALNITLLDAAEKEGARFFFNHRCLDIDPEETSAVFEEDRGPGEKPRLVPVNADLIVGADGAFSAVRTRLMKLDRFDFSQSYLSHGYKELHIPPAPPAAPPSADGAAERGDDRFALDPHALHIWPRGGSMMIALPNKDGSFTCTLFWPFDGAHSFNSLKTPEQVLRFFERHYPDFPPLSPTLAEDFFRNPTSSLITVRCRPWHHLSRAGATVIMGDAAHAIVPFYGQGMNAAFEDVRAFAECLDSHPGDLAAALAEFETLRKEHADAIADMALANFVEMRDKVASPLFRLRKRFEHALHAAIPRWYTPLYHMISFTTIPYNDARRRAAKQDRIILWTLIILAALLLGVVLGAARA